MQEMQQTWVDPWVGKIPWRRAWQSTPIFLPERFHGQRSLVGYSLWGCKELDMTEHTFIYSVMLGLSHWITREIP